MRKNYLLAACFMLISIQLVGCADMIRSLREDSAAADGDMPVAQRSRARANAEEPVYHPRTLTGLSANNVNSYAPPVRREYNRGPASMPDGNMDADSGYSGGDSQSVSPSNTRRLSRKDFIDADAKENSLWDGQGQNNYLFANNKRHELGDVVTVDVERELKREIQYTLYMNLPPEQRRARKPAAATDASADKAGKAAAPQAATAAASGGKSELEKGKDAAEEAAKTNMASNGKEDDVMRMEVVESTGGGMVRVLGQKRVIYRGVSRVVEIVALANSKDVDENGRVKSSAFIDAKTQVVQ